MDNRDSIKETGKNNGKACGNFGQVDFLSGSEWGEIHILQVRRPLPTPLRSEPQLLRIRLRSSLEFRQNLIIYLDPKARFLIRRNLTVFRKNWINER